MALVVLADRRCRCHDSGTELEPEEAVARLERQENVAPQHRADRDWSSVDKDGC